MSSGWQRPPSQEVEAAAVRMVGAWVEPDCPVCRCGSRDDGDIPLESKARPPGKRVSPFRNYLVRRMAMEHSRR